MYGVRKFVARYATVVWPKDPHALTSGRVGRRRHTFGLISSV